MGGGESKYGEKKGRDEDEFCREEGAEDKGEEGDKGMG